MTEQVDSARKARGRIQFAYSRLIGRFGPESDVIEALVEGLGLLKGLTDEGIKPAPTPTAPKRPAPPPKPKAKAKTAARKKAASGTADVSGDITTPGSSGRASSTR